MCKVWGVVTRKGGVGKTTTSTTMAYLLAKAGYKVALIDFDGQRHIAVNLSKHSRNLRRFSALDELFADGGGEFPVLLFLI